MKAFEVYYKKPGVNCSTFLIVKDESEIKKALNKKDKDYDPTSNFSKILSIREVPMSNIMIKDLSVAELLLILGK